MSEKEKKKKVEKDDKKRVGSMLVGTNNVVSQLFFIWVFFLIRTLKRTTNFKDLYLLLREKDTASFNDNILEKKWVKEKEEATLKGRSPLIRKAIFKAYGVSFVLNGIWKLLWGISLWFGAYWLLKQTIAFVRKNRLSEEKTDGHLYALGFLLSSVFASICIHQLLFQSGSLGLRLKAALQVQIFKKSLVLSKVAAGNIVNMVSNDCQKVADACTNLQYFWSAICEIIAIVAISFVELGYSAAPALGVILLLLPLQVYLARLKSQVGFENTRITSERVQIMSEILSAIRLIKFYAWEVPFYDRIVEIRRKELNLLKKNLIANAVNFMCVFCVPVITALLALLTYWLTGNVINPVIGFTIVSVFNTLRYPLLMAPLAINSASDSITALKRLDEFFKEDQIQPTVRFPVPTNSNEIISINNATFKWNLRDESRIFSLKQIDFHARKGQLTAVVGNVGSGKSSLLAALLGQMQLTEGTSKVCGQISYTPQEAWLLNMTLRENIVFGNEFNEDLYNQVIRVCALTRDIKLMPDGDRTEIGERGINLSGGQRQRISLARCCYKQSDVVLLDDPLSAVDQKVGRHIFEDCIKKYLQARTVIFVTHQLQYLSKCDYVYVVKDGRIAEGGTYLELMSRKDNGLLAQLIGQHVTTEKNIISKEKIEKVEKEIHQRRDSHISVSSSDDSTNETHPALLSPVQLENRRRLSNRFHTHINDEILASKIEENQLRMTINAIARKGMSIASQLEPDEPVPEDAEPMKLVLEDQSIHYKKSPALAYMQAGSGVFISVLIVAFFFLVHGIRIGSDYWFSQWFSKAPGKYDNISDAMFVGIYGGACGLFTIGILARGIVFSISAIKKSVDLHNKMFRTVIFARMSFFNATPVGRILNAFARHQYACDAQLSDFLMQLLQYLPLCLGAIILCIAVMYQTVGVFGGACIVGAFIIIYMGDCEAKLRDQDALTRSSIFSHLTATLEGLFSIRAFQCEERFIELFNQKIDNNHRYQYGIQGIKCWSAFYIDILVSFVIYTAIVVVVELRKEYPAATAGLVISNVLQLLVFLQWTIRMIGEMRDKLASVQQVSYYGNSIEQEPPHIIESNRPPEDWPSRGNIRFSKIVLKYHELGVAVLKSVSLNIKPREKVGIVGRTGSGKSTLLISLLRIVESSEGQIIIDGIDISKIGLRDLRSKITIIPQEPVLFVGSVRKNIDLFDKCTDEQIWTALDACQLGDVIRKMGQKLESAVVENGKNFSVGERQLFCLARAICSKSKIFVLDEATAAVDPSTDALIQSVIKTNFADFTILTIAHRLNTIMESDKILVMDAGKVVEFAPPLALLSINDGYFTSLLKETGPATFNELKRVAEVKAAREGNQLKAFELSADSDNIVVSLGDDLAHPQQQHHHHHHHHNHKAIQSMAPRLDINRESISEINENEDGLKESPNSSSSNSLNNIILSQIEIDQSNQLTQF